MPALRLTPWLGWALFVGACAAPDLERPARRERSETAAREVLARVRGALPPFQPASAPSPAGARKARVELARRASEATRVEDPASGVAASFALRGAAPARMALEEGWAIYPGALGAAADVLQRVVPEGVEDFVAFGARPEREELVYVVDVSRVAGLREVDGLLEMLDESGAPRLRVAPPYVIDARGARHAAELEVRGCRADRDPRAQFGRAVTPPGAPSCEVVVRWSRAAVAYPALVDPFWSTTGSMTTARASHAAAPLPSARVLVAGGDNGDGNSTASTTYASAEIYDAATGVWAATGPMPFASRGLFAVALPGGKVLAGLGGAAGGSDVPSSAVYDAATGTWSGAATVGFTARGARAAPLPGGKALVCGGATTKAGAVVAVGDAAVFDSAAGTWSAAPPLGSRYAHAVTTLADGSVLVTGGHSGTDEIASASRFDPATGTWKAAAPMLQGRWGHALTRLADGRVLVAGGVMRESGSTNRMLRDAEIYDPATNAWTATGSLSPAVSSPTTGTGVLMPTGDVLLVPRNELYDHATGLWHLLNTPPPAGGTGTVTPVGGGILVAGGATVATTASSLWGPLPNGEPCTVASECHSGFCVDGVCCDTACGTCQACTAAKKGRGPDGVCEPYADDTDPEDECPAESPQTCGSVGVCDGKGTCRKQPRGTVCAPGSCANASVTSSSCDGVGQCVPDTVVCAPYQCNGASCLTACTTDAHCAAGARCDLPTRTCFSGASCDGDHALVDERGESTDCAPYRCEGSSCKTACASVRDCVGGTVCDEGGVCVAPASQSTAAGCATVSGRPEAHLFAIGALAVGAALRRRRRLAR